MRNFLILSPLGMLLLTSCMPAGGSSSAGNNTNSDSGGQLTEKLSHNQVSHAQIAALASLGQKPLPRNMIVAVENTCPIHQEKMRIGEIPIVFEDAVDTKGDSTKASDTDEFPFGAEKITSSGNALLPGEPVTARVYQCPSCITAKRAADQKRSLSAALPKPE